MIGKDMLVGRRQKMLGNKKWLIVVTEDQYRWIKETSKETGLKGTHIVRAAIERQMGEDAKQFKASLAQTKLRADLEALETKQRELAEKEAELQSRLRKTERATV